MTLYRQCWQWYKEVASFNQIVFVKDLGIADRRIIVAFFPSICINFFRADSEHEMIWPESRILQQFSGLGFWEAEHVMTSFWLYLYTWIRDKYYEYKQQFNSIMLPCCLMSHFILLSNARTQYMKVRNTGRNHLSDASISSGLPFPLLDKLFKREFQKKK